MANRPIRQIRPDQIHFLSQVPEHQLDQFVEFVAHGIEPEQALQMIASEHQQGESAKPGLAN